MRAKIPNRRGCIRQSVQIGGTSRFYIDVDSLTHPREVWLRLKGPTIDTLHISLLDELAISCASRLQLGESLEEVFEPMLGTKAGPSGPVRGDHEGRIRFCSSVTDYLARYILVHCGGRDDLAHMRKPE